MSGDRATKMLILSSARTLFSEKGYNETAVEEICALAGVAKGTFFYYFESKQNIVRYIMAAQLKEYCEKLKEQMDTIKDPMSKVEFFVSALIEQSSVISEPEGYIKGGESEWFYTVIKEERMKILYPLLEDIVMEGMDEGLFRIKNPVICASVVFLGLDAYLEKEPADYEETRNGVRELTAKILGVKDTALVI
jgi:AcrR family transcriptional regulator